MHLLKSLHLLHFVLRRRLSSFNNIVKNVSMRAKGINSHVLPHYLPTLHLLSFPPVLFSRSKGKLHVHCRNPYCIKIAAKNVAIFRHNFDP